MKWGMFGLGLLIGIILCFLFSNLTYKIETVFSPNDGYKIIELIDSAEKSIDIEVYVFTSRDVIEALERAKNRGVTIRIIMEKQVIGGQNSKIHSELTAKHFVVKYASKLFELTHSKIIIIDGKIVLVGSHNLSNSALYENREASVIIYDQLTVNKFIQLFENDWILAF
ncbi:MAG: phospholipase D-like domain-containing protein [Candidatus Micrarchaeota archaeon]